MALILAPLLGFLLLRGHISLKNRSYRPLLRASTSPFKSTCLLIRLKEAKIDLYRRYKQRYKPVPTSILKSNMSQHSPEVQNRTRHVYYGEKRGTTENINFHLYPVLSMYFEYRNTHMQWSELMMVEPRGSRTAVQPVLPIRINH
jgi:hypothetical protein